MRHRNFSKFNNFIWFQHAAFIQKSPIYVSIVAQNRIHNGLSGKYNFHSMINNKPAFVHEGGIIPGLRGKNHYLVNRKTNSTTRWYIQSDKLFLGDIAGGYFQIITSGKYVLNCSFWAIFLAVLMLVKDVGEKCMLVKNLYVGEKPSPTFTS